MVKFTPAFAAALFFACSVLAAPAFSGSEDVAISSREVEGLASRNGIPHARDMMEPVEARNGQGQRNSSPASGAGAGSSDTGSGAQGHRNTPSIARTLEARGGQGQRNGAPSTGSGAGTSESGAGASGHKNS